MATTKQSEPKSDNEKAPAKRQKAEKPTRRIIDQYTGYSKIIEGKNEIDLENKCQDQFRKWDEEQAKREAKLAEEQAKRDQQQAEADYIQDQKNKASDSTRAEHERLYKLKQLHFSPKPHISTVESYVKDKASAEVNKRRVYMPDKEDYLRKEKIRWWKRILHRLREKWFLEDFNRAEKSYQEALKQAQEDQAASEREYAEALQKKEIPYRQEMGRMATGHEQEVFNYFLHALRADTFSVSNGRYSKEFFEPATYSVKAKELSFGYRIPSLQELDLIESVSFDERTGQFEYHDYNPEVLQQHALEIAESLLLRELTVLFKSDEYQVLKSVCLTGIITYLDEAYGKSINKPVILVKMTKEQFEELGDLSKVNAHALFDRILHVKPVEGLYLKENYEIPGLKLPSEEDKSGQ